MLTKVGGKYSTPDPAKLRLREKYLGIPQDAIVCDFCSARDPQWEYENYPTEREDGGWAACEECMKLIEADDREGLFKRSITHHPNRNSIIDGLQRGIRVAHHDFWDNRKEPVRAITP